MEIPLPLVSLIGRTTKSHQPCLSLSSTRRRTEEESYPHFCPSILPSIWRGRMDKLGTGISRREEDPFISHLIAPSMKEMLR